MASWMPPSGDEGRAFHFLPVVDLTEPRRQRLCPVDCYGDKLVLRGELATLFASFAPPGVVRVATLELPDHREYRVVVYATVLGERELRGGWVTLRSDLGLVPGDVVAVEETAAADRFLVRFYGADGNERLLAPDDPPSPDEIVLESDPASPRSPVFADWTRAPRASAPGGGGIALTQSVAAADLYRDPTARAIKQAMDLVVQSGAHEGSDEHYMATKLLVSAENRAMFFTFKTNQGRLSWLRRCYQDRNN
ncbi:hypothetical protein ACP70R_004681 [Stipagrostis hirtigluma subsp. patula]